jgi:selenocysteine lyase/cysteine desulfurase
LDAALTARFAEIRSLFPHTKNVVYLNSASTGPMSVPVRRAITDHLDLLLGAEKDDWHEAMLIADQLRGDYASLIGGEARQVGIGLSTSFGINVAAFGLPLAEGDEVIVSDIEFPAVVYAWRAAADTRGLKLRILKSRDGHFDIDGFERSITPRTRVLSLSWVQFSNGFKNDLARLSEICRRHNLFFVVDGIQGMGAEPIDVRRLDIDLFTSGCQKWMLSPQGCGFFYISDRIKDDLALPFFSWLGVDWQMEFTDLYHYEKPYFQTAQKFEFGYGVTLNLIGMKAAVRYFQDLGIENIQRHNHALLDRLAAYLDDSSVYSVTSSMDPKHRSSILTFTCRGYQTLHQRLVADGILVVHREGSIRVSAHLFNDESDIDRLISGLDQFAGSS